MYSFKRDWWNRRLDAYFPCSAVMYSSQEIVFGAGAVRDCLLTGCWKENISQWHNHSHQSTFTRCIPSSSPQSFVHWCCLLYSNFPWWLCSSGCPLHLGALAVFLTPAPDRSLHRSQPGSFQLSPTQNNKQMSVFHHELPTDFQFHCWFLKMYWGVAWG